MAHPDPTSPTGKLVSDITEKADRWRRTRQVHERQWFTNAAFLRGQHYQHFGEPLVQSNQLNLSLTQPQREKRTINRILPKVRARRAKALKNRPQPIVIPASSDREDRLNARATQKVLDYMWRKQKLEEKFRDAICWAEIGHKGFWWFHWDQSAMGRFRYTDPLTGQDQVVDDMIGDVRVEVGSPFEVLVADPKIHRIQDQPEIMRIRRRTLSEAKRLYPNLAKELKGDQARSDTDFEQRIASLSNRSGWVMGSGAALDDGDTHVTIKEWFAAPSREHPKGRYAVVVGDQLEREDDLPYQMADMPESPYPVVEFPDLIGIGQFWGTTMVEQLIGPQRSYNFMRTMTEENVRKTARPKLLCYKQHQIPDGAWVAAEGEMIEMNYKPGLPPPQVVQGVNIAPDVWKLIDVLKTEMEDISHIYPSVEGKTGQATSGFQTNLLQEAADSVHAPDIRSFELAVEEAGRKIRRLIKLGYDTSRLITIMGKNYEPEVIEFGGDQIDEQADIVVQAGSGLPQLKYSRVQTVIDLHDKGLFGNPQDPDVRRRVMSLLELGTVEDAYDYERRDEEQARLEGVEQRMGKPLPDPEFFENHQVHYLIHTDELKSPEGRTWPPEFRLERILHLVKHIYFIDPNKAAILAAEYGIDLAPLVGPPTAAPPQPVTNPPPAGQLMPGPAGPGGPVQSMQGPPPPPAAGMAPPPGMTPPPPQAM